jgi:HSP20 family protein
MSLFNKMSFHELVRFNRYPFYPGWMSENNSFNQNADNQNVSAVNIKKEEKSFLLELAAPGLKKEDFKINIEKNLLTISSEVRTENEEKTENYTRKEFGFSSFRRSFKISENILVDDISANYEDGILKVNLPKNVDAKLSREIKVA